jgi:hypothetical protein
MDAALPKPGEARERGGQNRNAGPRPSPALMTSKPATQEESGGALADAMRRAGLKLD